MKLFCTLFFLWFAFLGKGQEVNFIDQSQDHKELTMYIFDQSEFDAYQQFFKDSVVSFANRVNEPRNLQIYVRFSPKEQPFYSFSARPVLTDEERHQLQKKLMHLPSLKTSKLIFTQEIQVVINGGGSNYSPYSPLLENPAAFKKRSYEFGNLADDYIQIKLWSQEIKPIVKDKLNKLEDQENYSVNHKLNVYARSLLAVIDAISEGKYDYAQKMIPVFLATTPPSSLITYLLHELKWRLDYYFRAEMRICYALPQKEGDRFGKNLIALDSILSINPASEFAVYETLNQGIPTDKDLLLEYEQSRLNFDYSNPIRTDTFLARTAIEAYHNTLRIQFSNLLNDLKSEEKLSQLAEIGLELGAYEFSNLVYSILYFKSFKLEKEGNLVYSLRTKYTAYKYYPSIKKYLKNDLKQFKQLENELKKKMLNSTAYQNFKKRK